MRNLKKFLALVLAMLMVVSAGAAVSASFGDIEDNQYADAINKLAGYGIVNGTDEGVFSPDDGVERFQMAIMMARALKPNETNWNDGMAIFDDVDEWYGAIAYAYINNIVNGVCEDPMLFAPHDPITYAQALTMAVRALGYTVANGNPWWLPAYTKATELGLTNNMAASIKADDALTRAECAQIIANMLAAKPADGGATIEAKNFGVATIDNTTTFVITATAKQAYSETAKAAEKGYVGVQTIVNGIPTGDIKYLPVDVFGFTADEADDYFGYSFDFVNYNAATGAFDKIVPGLAPVVAYSNQISGKDNNADKFSFDGVTYYAVDAITGAALKNEIVIFNGGASAVKAKMLLTNRDGDIVDYNGTILAKFAYETPTGAKYFAVNGSNGTSIVSEPTALERFGVEVDNDSYLEYSTLEVDALTNNQQITFFDDNRDGKYDRAIVTNVYVSVYNNKDGDKVNITSNAFASDTKGVTFTKDLVKGDVFVYTYNAQTKVVDVLDVLAVQAGTIQKLDLSNYKANSDGSKNWVAKVTISGTTYTVGNSAQDGRMGATLCATGTAPSSVADIKDNARIAYVNDKLETADVLDVFANIGSLIRFVEYNGYIIFAETYAIEDSFDYMVVTDVETYDSNSIYVNGYLNGVYGTYAISKFVVNGKDVTLGNNTNPFTVSTSITNFYDNTYGKAPIYKAVKLENGTYQVSAAFDKNVGDDNYNKSFKLYKAAANEFKFSDGISNEVGGEKGNRIRTDANTKFFFINTTDGKVSIYTGKPANGSVIDATGTTNATVYADKIGYGDGGKYGVAKNVFVYYSATSSVRGFNISTLTETIVYVPEAGTYTVDSAANFGLTGESGTFFKYGAVAINMSKGTTMVVYTKRTEALESGKFYSVDEKGIATALTDAQAGKIETKTVDKVDLNNQYITVGNVIGINDKVSSLISYKSDKLDSKKTDNTYFKDGTVTVKYLKGDLGDHIAVMIVMATSTPVEPEKPTFNAEYSWKGTDYNAVYNADKKTITLYGADDKEDGVSASVKDTEFTVTISTFDYSTGTNKPVYGNADLIMTGAKCEKGVITLGDIVYKNNTGIKVPLEKGEYTITITFEGTWNTETTAYVVTYNATIA